MTAMLIMSIILDTIVYCGRAFKYDNNLEGVRKMPLIGLTYNLNIITVAEED